MKQHLVPSNKCHNCCNFPRSINRPQWCTMMLFSTFTIITGTQYNVLNLCSTCHNKYNITHSIINWMESFITSCYFYAVNKAHYVLHHLRKSNKVLTFLLFYILICSAGNFFQQKLQFHHDWNIFERNKTEISTLILHNM